MSLVVAKAGAALAAGNTVVVKPAEQACCSILRWTELFADAGLPPGVINVVTGLGEEAGRALVRHPQRRPHQLHRLHRDRPAHHGRRRPAP